jgi:hypothetical protein
MNSLIELDRQFSKDCQIDKERAWMSYLADETMIGTSAHHPYITNKSVIAASMARLFALDNISFTWEPYYAMLSDDRSLGFTTGMYQRVYLQDGEQQNEIGKYVTIWKQVGDTYKIVFDMGN